MNPGYPAPPSAARRSPATKRRQLVIVLVSALLVVGAASTAYALGFNSVQGRNAAAQDPEHRPAVSPTALAEPSEGAAVRSKEPGPVSTAGGSTRVAESKPPAPEPKPKPSPSGRRGAAGGPKYTAAYAGTWGSEWFTVTLEKGGKSAVLHPASGVCTWSLSLTGRSGGGYDASVAGDGACAKHDRARLALDGSDGLVITLKGGEGADAVKEIPLSRR